MEFCGIFASKDIHRKHHKHDYPTGYQYFFSSGLHLELFDNYGNEFWNYMYHKCKHYNYPMYDALWYPMTFVFILPIISLIFKNENNLR